HEGIEFLVMEYLEGETLADRLQRGALPLDESLRVAIEIADALDKAHRQGVTHRDLKPSNVMLTKSGTKLLDFGLAKLKQPELTPTVSGLPTRKDVTAQGTILGTLQYMSPEQLEGQEADARSDIFAFGTVLYEMVTSKKAFEGRSQASLIAAIMHFDPPYITRLQRLSPPLLERVVRKCLDKDPEDRWQNARDLLSQLEWINEPDKSTAVPAAIASPRPKRQWLLGTWAVFSTASALIIAVLAWSYIHGLKEPNEARFLVSVPAMQNPPNPTALNVSPTPQFLALLSTP